MIGLYVIQVTHTHTHVKGTIFLKSDEWKIFTLAARNELFFQKKKQTKPKHAFLFLTSMSFTVIQTVICSLNLKDMNRHVLSMKKTTLARLQNDSQMRVFMYNPI